MRVISIPLNQSGVTRGLILPDMHVPDCDREAMNAIYKYVKGRKYDFVVSLGDWCDFNSISAHNRHALGKVENLRVLNDILGMRSEISRLRQAVGPRPRIYWIQGNHEYRLVRYLDEHPELKGLPDFDLSKALDFDKNGITWVQFWEQGDLLRAGKLYMGHGRRVGPGHTARNLRDYETNLVTGHTHSYEISGKVIAPQWDYRVAVSLGSLQSQKKARWMQGRPSAWVTMFGEVFLLPDGSFTLYSPVIVRGRFVGADGVVYSGRKKRSGRRAGQKQEMSK